MTSLAPGVFAGVDKVIVSESITVTFEAASVPKFTLVPSIKLAPLIVAYTLPETVPKLGVMLTAISILPRYI